jgi:hypothetical protein
LKISFQCKNQIAESVVYEILENFDKLICIINIG